MPESATLDDVLRELAALREVVLAMSARPRRVRVTDVDLDLLHAIVEVFGDRLFVAADVVAASDVPLVTRSALSDALAAAGIRTAVQLGKRLQRLVGQRAGDFLVERAGVERAGAVWMLRRSSPLTPASRLEVKTRGQ